MPQSLILNLVPEASIPQQHLNGAHLHHLFLNLVSSVDPQLGRVLAVDSQNHSFSLSPLQVAPRVGFSASMPNLRFLFPRWGVPLRPLQYRYQSEIPAGASCWWRISLLDDGLFGHLSRAWQKVALQQPWFLGSTPLHITGLCDRAHRNPDWARVSSYQQLYEQASDQTRDIRLQFLTPATFGHGGYESPLPTRDAVFHCLRKRWNRHSGLAFAPSLIEPIMPVGFDIQTEVLQDTETKIVGCLGQITFRIVGDVDALTIKRINTVADYTLFCGIGHQTTLGMGIVRRIQVKAS
ncbi:MAG: CRISPR system precrRNA processing endoribonuclease RAMP protein Cas6 [Cyanobacteria bacterium P01_A01_bin.114]